MINFIWQAKPKRANRGKNQETKQGQVHGGKSLYTRRRQLDEGEPDQMDASTPGTRIRDKNEQGQYTKQALT